MFLSDGNIMIYIENAATDKNMDCIRTRYYAMFNLWSNFPNSIRHYIVQYNQVGTLMKLKWPIYLRTMSS